MFKVDNLKKNERKKKLTILPAENWAAVRNQQQQF